MKTSVLRLRSAGAITAALVTLWVASTTAQVLNPLRIVYQVDARTIASNGGGTPATLTLTPTASYVTLTCNDPDGCTITMGEAGIASGTRTLIVNVSANTCTFSDSAGVSELSGTIALGQWQALDLEYVTDRWVQAGVGGSGSGTVTTTGSPANGNLAAFSGASSLTNTNLTGDVTTTNTVATTIANDAVSNAKLRNSGALSVIGRSANSSGDPADISASAASDAVLRESGSTVGFGTIATAGIANGAVTYAKMQDVSAASRFLCRGSAAGSGDVEECTFGSGLSLSGTQLTATGGGGGGGSSVYPTRAEGRLTTESGVPISTSNRTAQSTLYWTPCVSQNGTCVAVTTGVITLWNGTDAVDFATTQLTKTITGLSSGKPYDVFIDYNSGAPQIVLSAAWTTDTARADALATQYDSTRQVTLPIKSGTPAYRWVGTIYTTGTTTIEDSETKRYVWNLNNQVPRRMYIFDTTDSWTYTTATLRQGNAAAANQLDYVTGMAAQEIEATLYVSSLTSVAASWQVNIGVDSTTVGSAHVGGTNGAANQYTNPTAIYSGSPGLGRHVLVWLEQGGGTGTTTWYGDHGGSLGQSGMIGKIWNYQ